MFEALRRMILPIIVIVLVFFMGMIVLQWGLDLTGSQRYSQANAAGVINGEEISWNLFQSVYNNVLQSESQATDAEIPDARLRELEQYAWDQIVNDRLLTQEANKQNIIVTDDDIYLYLRLSPPTFLQQAPVFQTDGQFDYQKYLNLMAEPQAAPMWASIEPEVKNNLRMLKIQRLVSEAAHVTESEIRQSFLDSEEKVTVGIVNARKSLILATIKQPTTEERSAYFAEHLDDYQIDERVVLTIVKASKNPTDYDWEIARATAQDISDSALAGADFAELATTWSEDPGSATNGGDLGFFPPGQMVPPFDSAAFEMAEGDISPPIRSQFGFHVLKHHGYQEKEDGDGREAHVSHVLIKARASSETLDIASRGIDNVLLRAQETDLQAAAEELGLEFQTTPPLRRYDIISFLGGAPQVSTWAFAGEPGDLSDLIETNANYCGVFIDQRLPSGPATFEDAETAVGQDLRNQLAVEKCRDTIGMVLDEINSGASIAEAATKFGFEYQTLAPFARTSTVGAVGSDPAPVGAAFALKEPGDRSAPIDYPEGTVLLELIAKSSADLVQFNEKRDSIRTSVLNIKRQLAYQDWYTHLLANSEIQNNVQGTR